MRILFLLVFSTVCSIASIHAQISRYEPFGGAGTNFSDICNEISAVKIKAGWWIDGIQLVCSEGAKPFRGGTGGSLHTFKLGAGEYITRISGTAFGQYGPYVVSIQLHTNRRSSPIYGVKRGSKPFNFTVPSGSKITGLNGRFNKYLGAIGVFYKPIYTPPSRPIVGIPQLTEPAYNAQMDNGCTSGSDQIKWGFRWRSIQGAARYQLAVYQNIQTPVVNTYVYNTYYDHVQSGYIPNQNTNGWKWKLRAEVQGVWSDWTQERPFYLEPMNTDCPVAVAYPPALNYPQANAQMDNGCSTQTQEIRWGFQWSSINRASNYNLVVYNSNSGRPAVDQYTHLTSFDHVQQGYIATHLLNGWNWKVRAFVNGRWTDFTPPRAFYVEPPNTDCQPVHVAVAPRLNYPYGAATLENGCLDHSKDFQWSFGWYPVEGATQYQLYVSKQGAGNPLVDKVVRGNSYVHKGGKSYVANHNLSGWQWRVRSMVGGVWSPWSGSKSFNVQKPCGGNRANGGGNAIRVKIANSGAYVAKFKITYVLKGSYKSWNSGSKTAGWSDTITLPVGATAVKVTAQAHTGLSWKNIFSAPISTQYVCYKVSGTTFSTSYSKCN